MPEQLCRIRDGRTPGGRARVERQLGPAAEGCLDQPARVEHLGDDLHVGVGPAVRGARQGQVALSEPEPLEHAGAHAAERLQRLDGRPREHGQLGIRPGDRALGMRDAPRDAVLGLRRPATHRDDARQERFSRQRTRLSSMIRSATSRSYQPSTTTSLPSGCL